MDRFSRNPLLIDFFQRNSIPNFMKIRQILAVDTRSQTEGHGRHISHFFKFVTNNPRIQCVCVIKSIIIIDLFTLLNICLLANHHPSLTVGGIRLSQGKEFFLSPPRSRVWPRDLRTIRHVCIILLFVPLLRYFG